MKVFLFQESSENKNRFEDFVCPTTILIALPDDPGKPLSEPYRLFPLRNGENERASFWGSSEPPMGKHEFEWTTTLSTLCAVVEECIPIPKFFSIFYGIFYG